MSKIIGYFLERNKFYECDDYVILAKGSIVPGEAASNSGYPGYIALFSKDEKGNINHVTKFSGDLDSDKYCNQAIWQPCIHYNIVKAKEILLKEKGLILTREGKLSLTIDLGRIGRSDIISAHSTKEDINLTLIVDKVTKKDIYYCAKLEPNEFKIESGKISRDKYELWTKASNREVDQLKYLLSLRNFTISSNKLVKVFYYIDNTLRIFSIPENNNRFNVIEKKYEMFRTIEDARNEASKIRVNNSRISDFKQNLRILGKDCYYKIGTCNETVEVKLEDSDCFNEILLQDLKDHNAFLTWAEAEDFLVWAKSKFE
jgi:hypothetical protein